MALELFQVAEVAPRAGRMGDTAICIGQKGKKHDAAGALEVLEMHQLERSDTCHGYIPEVNQSLSLVSITQEIGSSKHF